MHCLTVLIFAPLCPLCHRRTSVARLNSMWYYLISARNYNQGSSLKLGEKHEQLQVPFPRPLHSTKCCMCIIPTCFSKSNLKPVRQLYLLAHDSTSLSAKFFSCISSMLVTSAATLHPVLEHRASIHCNLIADGRHNVRGRFTLKMTAPSNPHQYLDLLADSSP